MLGHRAIGCIAVGLVVQQLAASGAAVALPRQEPSTPAIFPTPRRLTVAGSRAVQVTGTVVLVASAGADPSAVKVAQVALQASGATVVAESATGAYSDLLVVIGRSRLEQELGVKPSTGLPPGGYVLAAGYAETRPVIVLDGVDSAGEFYAAQTLRQVLSGRRSMPALRIRDWPSFPERGVIEGFYGSPWSVASTLSMLDFLGQHKLNTFIYLPKNVVLLRDDWRAPLTEQFKNDLAEIARRAVSDHVSLDVGVSPGASICYSSATDQNLLLSKLNALWRLGVRSFALAFDDITTSFACSSDTTVFGTGEASLARAQANLINVVDARLRRTHPAVGSVSMVPTEYSGLTLSAYRAELAADLRPDVVIEWTGAKTLASSITTAQAGIAVTGFAHPVSVWDNYFVNDYLPGAVVLGPFMERSSTLFEKVSGICVNPLSEATAARIGLFTFADYSWNPLAYEPQASWQASLNEFSASDRQVDSALSLFAATNFTPAFGYGQAPQLTSAISGFWTGWNEGRLDAGVALRAQLEQLRDAPSILERHFTNVAFLAEMKPWFDATTLWAAAAIDGLDSMIAQRQGLASFQRDQDEARALREQALSLSVPGVTPTASIQVAGGALALFVHLALRGYGP